MFPSSAIWGHHPRSALNVQVQSRLLSTLTTGLLELNVHVGDAVAQTALENNWSTYFQKKNQLHRRVQQAIREAEQNGETIDPEAYDALFPGLAESSDHLLTSLRDSQEFDLETYVDDLNG